MWRARIFSTPDRHQTVAPATTLWHRFLRILYNGPGNRLGSLFAPNLSITQEDGSCYSVLNEASNYQPAVDHYGMVIEQSRARERESKRQRGAPSRSVHGYSKKLAIVATERQSAPVSDEKPCKICRTASTAQWAQLWPPHS